MASSSTVLLVGGKTPGCPRGEETPSPEGKTSQERFGHLTMAKGQAWLLVTSGSALTMSFDCLTWHTLANKEKYPKFPAPAGLLLFQRYHRIIESESFRLEKLSKVIESNDLPGAAPNHVPKMPPSKSRRAFPWWPEVSPRLISVSYIQVHGTIHLQIRCPCVQGSECPARAAGHDFFVEDNVQGHSVSCSGSCARSKKQSFKMQMSRTTLLFNCRGSSSVDFSKEPSAREKHCPGRCCRAEWRFALCG